MPYWHADGSDHRIYGEIEYPISPLAVKMAVTREIAHRISATADANEVALSIPRHKDGHSSLTLATPRRTDR
ncbi:hypothetical protein ACFPES_30460 [Paenibacillus sp. GCM10023248]|uniref:hypothetical protein n=1 Tax=Bacillales TaxID=1385 RepID=UPI0023788511|nr:MULTISPECIES: hypothetical protein [Bacillales]MDD9271367.1 hypothetical protein [Paenibacillus sp. MAHUQ-63]MDR6881511.1 hypothetical protein [Bacillus sp. 3255]